MADFEKLKNKRTAYKGHITRVEKELTELLAKDRIELIDLQGLKNSYVEKIERVKELDTKISDLISDDLFDREMEEQLTYYEGSFRLLASIDSKLAAIASSASSTPTVQSNVKPLMQEPIPTPTVAENRTKLPRLIVKEFDGTILSWQSFWEQFSSAVHDRSDLSTIDKFSYLKSLLTDKAEKVISGLSLSAENYKSAVELLEERYGNKQAQINAHMENMLKLAPVKSMGNLDGLRKLYDCIETSIRNLNALGVSSAAYGALLVPLINEKLPDELKGCHLDKSLVEVYGISMKS